MILGTPLVTILGFKYFFASNAICMRHQWNWFLPRGETNNLCQRTRQRQCSPSTISGQCPNAERPSSFQSSPGIENVPKTTKKKSAISSNQLTIPQCVCVCPLISKSQLAKDAKPWEKSGQLSNQFWSNGESTIVTNNYLPEKKYLPFCYEAKVLIFDSFQHAAQITWLEDWFQDKNKLLKSLSLASVLVSTIRSGKQWAVQ